MAGVVVKDRSVIHSSKPAKQLLVFLACVAAFVAVLTLPALRQVFPESVYLPLHSTLEFASIVVSFSVFIMGWYSFRQSRNRQDLLIAAIYLTMGILDFVHTLSYKGMPDYFGPNTAGKAAAYWLVARFFDGAALFGAAFIAPGKKETRSVLSILAIVGPLVLCSVAIAIITRYEHAIGHALFNPDIGLTPLKIGIEYVIVLLYVAAYIAFSLKRRWNSESTELLQIALILNVFAELAFTRYVSPYDGANLLGHVFKVGSYYLVLRALFVLSLQQPYTEAKKHQEAFMQERKVLDQLQRSFLPIKETPPTGYQIAHEYKPVQSDRFTGGDFFDVFSLPDGRWAIMICDVSGKGLGATANAVTVKQTLRAYALEDAEPVSVITKLNKVMCRDLSDGLFVTLFYGVLEPSTGRLAYVNAGHEQPIHIQGKDHQALDSTGPVLGVSPSLPFEQAELTISTGDIFALMTDGITECRTLGGMLEIDGAARMMLDSADSSASGIVEHVFRTLQETADRRDDAVLIVIKRTAE